MSFEAVFSDEDREPALFAAHGPQRGEIFVRLRDVVVVRSTQLLEQFISSVNSAVLVLFVRISRWIRIDHPQPSNNKIRADDGGADVRRRQPVEHALEAEDHLRWSRLDDLPPSDSQSRVAERVFRGRGFVDD